MTMLHDITQEGASFQRRALFVFAKFVELPLLRCSYQLLRGRWKWLGSRPLFKKIMGLVLARPLALYGDSARPVPYKEIVEHINRLEGAIAVGACRCRISHHSCPHPLDTDIVIRTGTEAWLKAFPREYRVIEKQEALNIVARCHELGMFHMLFYHFPSHGKAEYVICNCCECGCVPYIINRELGQRYFPLLRGHSVAVTIEEKCDGSGECVAACPFGQREIINGKGATLDCFGCGLCAAACPANAILMKHSEHEGDEHFHE
jgi:ferredoxin